MQTHIRYRSRSDTDTDTDTDANAEADTNTDTKTTGNQFANSGMREREPTRLQLPLHKENC